MDWKPPPAYTAWASMKDRCTNPNNRAWSNYGGRGIGVCDRWKSYANFAQDMLPRLPGYSLERINNERGYSPCNCYWASRKAQQRNRRCTRVVEIEGETYRAADLAERFGLKTDTIVKRAKLGMTMAQVGQRGRHHNPTQHLAANAAVKAKAQNKTHCRRGHELTPANTYVTKQGWRTCRHCHADKVARQRVAKAASL